MTPHAEGAPSKVHRGHILEREAKTDRFEGELTTAAKFGAAGRVHSTPKQRENRPGSTQKLLYARGRKRAVLLGWVTDGLRMGYR